MSRNVLLCFIACAAFAAPAGAEGSACSGRLLTARIPMSGDSGSCPAFRLLPDDGTIAMESSYHAVPLRTLPSPPTMPTRAQVMGRAFTRELRDETIRSRRAALYATIPEELPQLLEDDYIREQRADVAESAILGATEAALGVAIFGERAADSRVTFRPTFAVADHGMALDATPAWAYRIRGPHGGFRFEAPMTASSFRIHAYRDLRGTNRTPLRLGSSLVMDPWDDSVRAAISFSF